MPPFSFGVHRSGGTFATGEFQRIKGKDDAA